MSTPILILSDAPTASSGLGRITRDLATLIHNELPEFRVATLGYGGAGSRHLPFSQYSIGSVDNWIVHELPFVWKDFAGANYGIILTVWDASRLLWFARPEQCPDPTLRHFLETAKIQKWGYFPIDAAGPNNKLSVMNREVLKGFDRVLAYSDWAANLIDNTMDDGRKTESLPHGIDTEIFFRRNPMEARRDFGLHVAGVDLSIPWDETLVGIVATNQSRKDFGNAIKSFANLNKKKRLWIHTDTLERHWSIPALLYDFDLIDKALVTTGDLSDRQLAWGYSACDITLGIGCAEGFGYSIFESLACGTPVIHVNYGGAAEHLPASMLVEPEMFRLEGLYNCVRPVVLDYDIWHYYTSNVGKEDDVCLPPQLNWDNLRPRWMEWFRKGISE